MSRACYNCGMAVTGSRCLKCDGVIAEQTDGSTVWIDIAHQRETVNEALVKLEREIADVNQGLAKYLTLIVGDGKIRSAVIARLGDLEVRSTIIGFEVSETNRGQLLVQLKR